MEAIVANWGQGYPTYSRIQASAGAPKGGVDMAYHNGKPCNSPSKPPRIAHIQFICDEAVKGPLSAGSDGTQACSEPGYTFVYPTIYACPGHAGDGGDSGGTVTVSTSLSGGWVFIIILLVSVFIYVVAGLAYNKKRNDIWQCPQWDFWKTVPGLVFAGFGATFNCIKGLFGKGSTKSGAGYDEIE